MDGPAEREKEKHQDERGDGDSPAKTTTTGAPHYDLTAAMGQRGKEIISADRKGRMRYKYLVWCCLHSAGEGGKQREKPRLNQHTASFLQAATGTHFSAVAEARKKARAAAGGTPAPTTHTAQALLATAVIADALITLDAEAAVEFALTTTGELITDVQLQRVFGGRSQISRWVANGGRDPETRPEAVGRRLLGVVQRGNQEMIAQQPTVVE
jgi:hypothetical protein